MVVSKNFLHFSKHHFPKDSESGRKSSKISSLSFLPDLNHPNVIRLLHTSTRPIFEIFFVKIEADQLSLIKKFPTEIHATDYYITYSRENRFIEKLPVGEKIYWMNIF